MQVITTGLIVDGSSDRALIPLIKQLFKTHLAAPFSEPELIAPPVNNLTEKIKYAVTNFSFDLLFVHRDAENEPTEKRVAEITQATPMGNHPVICVIPVKMTESWLLSSESAIRHAVGNPNSKVKLTLPKSKQIESCDAKLVLNTALTTACEHGTQRRRKFNPEQYRYRVAELTTDLVALRKIPSFRKLEMDLIDMLKQRNIPNVEV
jgi:hypothetical protein